MKAWLAVYPGDAWAIWTLALLVQVTVLLSLASVASSMLKRRPAARHTLWLFALAGVIASPFVTLAVRQSAPIIEAERAASAPVRLPQFGVAEPRVAALPDTPARGNTAAAFDRSPSLIAQPKPASIPRELEPPAASRLEALPLAARTLAIPSADGLPVAVNIAIVVWSSGTVFFLVRLLTGLSAVARLRASGRRCEDPRVLRLTESAAAGLRLRRRPQLLVSPATPGPLLLGVRRPVVLLPTELPAALDDAALTAVLRHEFAHAARGDALVGLLAQFTRAIWWPHPLMWRLCRELDRAREELCDNAAVQTADRTAYAETLLAVATFRPGGRMPTAGYAFLGPKRSFETRIVNLLDRRRSMTTTTTWGVRMGMALLVGTAATLGAWGTRGWASDAKGDKAEETARGLPNAPEAASEQPEPKQVSEPPVTVEKAGAGDQPEPHRSQFEWENARRYLSKVEMSFNRFVAAEQQFRAVDSAHRAGTVSLDMLLDAIRRKTEASAAYYDSMRKVRMSIMEDEFADTIRHRCLLEQLPHYEKGVEDSRQLLLWIVANRPSAPHVTQASDQLELMQDQLKAHKTRIALSEEGMLPQGRLSEPYPVTYVVEDLLDEAADTREQLKMLGDLLVRTISRDSWDTHGGPGSVSPYEKNRCLVICQTAEGHEQVAKLLEQIRSLKEPRDGKKASTDPNRDASK